MHELRIAESIVKISTKEIERQHLTGIRAIGVRIGALAGVNADSLLFGFEAITVDTPLAGVKLEVEEVPVKGKCHACQKDFEIKEFIFVCPHCYSSDIEISQGQELDIAYIETD